MSSSGTREFKLPTASEHPSLPLPQRLGASHYEENALLKTLRSVEQGLRARLRSIEHDASNVLRLYADLFPHPDRALPLYGNARAGSWYVPPVVNGVKTRTCSFKSADGHYGQWSSSLRRPNIHVLRDSLEKGGVILVDVTRRGKHWPDSFTKTVPIWCAVINIVTGLIKCECERSAASVNASSLPNVCSRCMSLHLHPDVPDSEREQILARFPHWVDDWQKPGLSLDQIIPALSQVRTAMKPLRPLWVRTDSPRWVNGLPLDELAFTPIVCISASRVVSPRDRSYIEPRAICETIGGVKFARCEAGFPYVQGAGDDEEAWSRGLTPALMWEYREILMKVADMSANGSTATQIEEALEEKIEELTARHHAPHLNISENIGSVVFSIAVWNTRVSLTCTQGGSLYKIVKQATNSFDTVIALGEPRPGHYEADEKMASGAWRAQEQTSEAWFSLRDTRGKVDHKYGFGRALGPCLSLLRRCCVDNKKEALICCTARDGDWSAGLAIAWVAWHCTLLSAEADVSETIAGSENSSCGYMVTEERKEQVEEISKTHIHNVMLHFMSAYPQFQLSRPTLKQLNRFFSSPNPSSAVSENFDSYE